MAPAQIQQRSDRLAFAALLAGNLFLAFGPWLVRLADVGAVAAGFWRLALAVPLLLLLAVRIDGAGALRPPRGLLVAIVLGGLFFAADLAVWHVGIRMTKLANATLFGNTASLIFAVYGFVLARALPSRVQGLALALAAIGGALLLGSSYELSPDHLAGDLLSILAGLLYFLYLVAIDRARRTLPALSVLSLATIAGAPPLLLAAAALGETILPAAWTPLLLLSLGSQVLGQGFLVFAIGRLSPLVVGLGLLTQPIVTATVGWLVYRERLGPVDLVGAVLIAAALVLVRLQPRAPADI